MSRDARRYGPNHLREALKRSLEDDFHSHERRIHVTREVQTALEAFPPIEGQMLMTAWWGRDFHVAIHLGPWSWLALGFIHLLVWRRVHAVVRAFFLNRYGEVPTVRVTVA